LQSDPDDFVEECICFRSTHIVNLFFETFLQLVAPV